MLPRSVQAYKQKRLYPMHNVEQQKKSDNITAGAKLGLQCFKQRSYFM